MGNLKKCLILVFLMTLSMPAVLSAMSGSGNPEEVFHPQIKETKGPVMVKGKMYAVWEPAEEGMLLLAGDVVRTEKGGFARIEFPSGTIEIYETTVMVIPSIGPDNRKKDIRDVVVEEGSVLFDINPLGVERGFEFRTKNVQGGVKGTLFTVSYKEDGTSVNVYRGVVRVSDLEGSEETTADLTAGSSVRIKERPDFGKVHRFDPQSALEDYSYDVPPGLDGKGLPSDSNANPDNRGVRDRGKGLGRNVDKDKDK